MSGSLFKDKEIVIWDWNGTLLNDAHICVESMNALLNTRKMRSLDLEIYREVFTFPVRDYYATLGFDFNAEPFEIPAMEFMDEYHRLIPEALLHPDSRIVLKTMEEKGLLQVVLSAMEQNNLNRMLRDHRISHYFVDTAGLDDHLAHGKQDTGHRLMARLNRDKSTMIMIGDTLHDKEVADELGVDCVLVAAGHQSAGRLMTAGCPVVNNLSELLL